MASHSETLLEVRDLRVYFGPAARPARAVDGVSFDVRAGETIALVGESGCGKTVTALSLARLVPEPPGWYAGGEVRYLGHDILKYDQRALRRLRGGEIAYVFQEPADALNPLFTIGAQVAEAIRLHRDDADARALTMDILDRVGLPDPQALLKTYPHQLSGGMQQRVMIAMALACRPKLLVADEPTTALDVTIQAEIMDLLARLQAELGMAILLITHNLGLVAQLAGRVHVMYAGRLVESGPVREVLDRPAHPYTRALLEAVPRLTGSRARVSGIPGAVPDSTDWPAGCRFHPRCSLAQPVCREKTPADESAGEGHAVACHFWRPA
ncbi:MAG: ABC transporter ATP-binding protein [Verrucomicrobia bacterium]|nr:ABC transporter ATP-binding protein [Verrucomicrobiota bacterium]